MRSSTNCSETKSQHADQAQPQLPVLFGLVIFAAVALLLSRGVLPAQESPAFSLPSPAGIRILLGAGFPEPGVHQFSDGMTVASVIELTGVARAGSGVWSEVPENTGVVDGMTLAVDDTGLNPGRVELGWMTARQRLALGIPLHPDRMSREDWVTLPGIGEKLAAQIELDRQKLGDFGDFEALDRVKGIGPAKLKALRAFF